MHLCISTADLRAEPSPEIYATDATPTRGGATVASVPPSLARALYRVAESRGTTIRLDGGLQHEAEAKLLHKSDVTDALAMSLEWTEVSNYTFRKPARINLQEARALRREIRREGI